MRAALDAKQNFVRANVIADSTPLYFKEQVVIEINKNVPQPPTPRTMQSQYPFIEMEVGDSFFIAKPANTLGVAVQNFKLRHPGIKFTVRSCVESNVPGCRVWRIS